MPAFRIEIDPSLCSGFGACIEEAPHAVEIDSAGTAIPRVAETDDPAAPALANACPMGAIAVYRCCSGERAA